MRWVLNNYITVIACFSRGHSRAEYVVEVADASGPSSDLKVFAMRDRA